MTSSRLRDGQDDGQVRNPLDILGPLEGVVEELAGESHADAAIDAANRVKREWSEMPWDNRATVLLKAAELLAGKYRQNL